MNAYMRKAAMDDDDKAKVAADYAGAVKAGEGLTRSRMMLNRDFVCTGADSNAAIRACRPGAGPIWDRTGCERDDAIFAWAVPFARKKLPQSDTGFGARSDETPTDVNIFRELGYDYEASKQYAKALGAYQKGAAIAPDDAFFKDSIARVTPYAN